MNLRLPTLIIIACTLMRCSQQVPTGQDNALPSHKALDGLLNKYVNVDGLVDYQGFQKDTVALNQYIQTLTSNPPSTSWPSNTQLAYWINLYNAATIQLILQHYPISSIKDIGSSVQIPFVNTPWQIEFIEFQNVIVDLDYIEHSIMRDQFDEPRIHFALVCAAISCPRLRNEAYQGEHLDEQLSDQARVFLADIDKNIIEENNLRISKIFRWYGGDFKKKTTLIEYLNSYSPILIDKDAEIDFVNYYWDLNQQ